MDGDRQAPQFFFGWDVGGWNCERNRASRDAVVILDVQGALVGAPWRGNLRSAINEARDTQGWLAALFSLCGAQPPEPPLHAVLAIDTPLGFSSAFAGLMRGIACKETVGRSETNPYLFRTTERYLFAHGLKPLSPLKDMIGSQATKGMHVLGRFAPHREGCGVWGDGAMLTAIEAYPSACRKSLLIRGELEAYRQAPGHGRRAAGCMDGLDHQDKVDALICALIARLFTQRRETLATPAPDTPLSEGWIWVPKDALRGPD